MNKNKLSLFFVFLIMLVFSVFSVNAYTNEDILSLNNNITSYWKFDESSDTTAEDSVSTNNGAVFGATWTTSGKINNALDFDGSNDDVDTNFYQPLTASDNFSHFAWIKTTSTNRGGIISNYGTTHGTTPAITIEYGSSQTPNNVFRAFLHDGSNNKDYDTGSTEFNDGNWHHVGITYNGNTQDLKLYADGNELSPTKRADHTLSGNLYDSARNIRIANDNRPEGLFFDGIIDEVGIWDRALSSDEIEALYNDGDGLQYPFEIEDDANITTEINLESDGDLINGWYNDNVDFSFNVFLNTTLYKTLFCIANNATCTPNPFISSGDEDDFVSAWRLGHFDTDLSVNETADYFGANNGTMVGFDRNDGNVSGGVTIEDGAMVFDGDGDYVDVSSDDFNLTDNFSFFAWIKQNSNPTTVRTIFGRRDSGGFQYQFRTVSGTILSFLDSSSSKRSFSITNGEWTFVGFTVDSGDLTIYKNLESDELGAVSITSQDRGTFIGDIPDANSSEFNGSISDVLIFNRSLNEDEIEEIYNASRDSYSPISDGLVAQYSGKDFAGTTSNPTKIYDTNMIVSNNVTGGTAMVFDGVDDYVSIPDDDVLDVSTQATWSFWGETFGNYGGIIDKYVASAGLRSYRIYMSGTNELTIAFSDDGSDNQALSSTNNCGLYNNILSHHTITYDSGETKWYKNGELCETRTSAMRSLHNSTTNLNIGRQIASLSYFNGSISDVLIFNRSLNEDEIEDMYNYQKASYDTYTLSDDGIYNISYYSVDTGGNAEYLNFTYVNISRDLIDIHIRAKTKYGEEYIDDFTVETETGNYSTTNGLLGFTYELGNHTFNITTDNYFNKTDVEFQITESNYSFVVDDFTNAKIQFIDKKTSEPFNASTVTLTYPDGSEFNLLTNSTGHVEVAGEIINETSQFNLTFGDFSGYVTPITFTFNLTDTLVETKEIDQTSITINVYDYETNNLLTENVTINIVDHFSVNTNNGTISIQNVSITSGEVGIFAISDGYLTTQKTFIYTDQEDITVSLYMKNATMENIGKLYTYTLDENYYGFKGADVRLLKYFPDEGEYKEVEQCYSNANGECVFNIVLGTERYIVTSSGTVEGVDLFTQSSQTGDFFLVDETRLELYLKYEIDVVLPDDFDLIVQARNTTLINNTSYLNVYFNDPSGLTHTVCIEYFYLDSINKISVTEKCTTGSSGTIDITGGYLLNSNYTYIVDVYTKNSDGDYLKLYHTFKYLGDRTFTNTFNIYIFPIIITLMAVILGVSIMSGNITIFPIGIILLSLVSSILRPDVFTVTTISVIIFFNVLLLYISRKANDLEAI